MSLEETDTADSTSSLSGFSSVNDKFDTIHLDFGNFGDDEIEPESDGEVLKDHRLTENVISTSEDNTINRIDCYRHFITDEIICRTILTSPSD